MTLAGRSGWGRCWTALVLTVLVLVSSAAPASAGSARLGAPVASGEELHLPLTVAQLPPETTLDTASVQVRMNGHVVPSSAVRTSRDGSTGARSVILLMDVSGSMRGARIENARTAALTFVDEVPADVRVGLVTFAGEVSRVVPPTLDRARLRSAVQVLRARGQTQLNDGVISAVAALGAAGDRGILLLSDGAHEGSATTTQQAAAAVRTGGVGLTAVDIGGSPEAAGQLTALAAAGKGALVRAADAASLTAAFKAVAREFREQVAVVANVPPELSGQSVTVDVSVTAGAQTYAASTRATLPQVAQAPVAVEQQDDASAARPYQSRLLWLGALLVFLALVTVSVLLVGPGRHRAHESRNTRRLIEAYTLGAKQEAAAGSTVDDSPVAQALIRVAGRLVGGGQRGLKTARRLDQAAVSMRPAEWLLLQCAVAVVVGLMFALLFRGGMLGFALGVVVGVLATGFWLRMKADRRRAAFVDGLPDALQLIASGLSSGYSFAQALDSVVRDGAQPVAGEIGRALAESRLGVSLEDALDNVAARMESDDMGWIVMAVRVQRDTGGNLAEVLHTVFETMRERARIRREVRTLSAEGRMSAWVLIALPIFMAGFQLLFRRDYMRPLYTEPAGIWMLVFTVISVVIGAVWTNKLVKVEA